MISDHPGFVRLVVVFGLAGLALQVVLLGVGTTISGLTGRGIDWNSALLGCGIVLIGGCVGSIPVSWKLAHDPARVGIVVLGSSMLRFVTVLGLVAPIALLTSVDRVSLVVWVGVGYMLTLAADTFLAVSLMRRMGARVSS